MFWNAIHKYGWEDFDHEILEQNISSQKEANDRECYWVSFYDTFYSGYNLTLGGDAKEQARLMSKDEQTIKVLPKDFEQYLAEGWMFHDSKEYRPIKHRKWYEEHKAEQNERTKIYYDQHRDELKARNSENSKKLWEDPEFRAKKMQYRKEHPELMKEIQKRYTEKHKNDPEYKRRHAEANRKWREKQQHK